MNVKLKKWGNSLGFRIPHTIAKELALEPEQEYEVSLNNSEIILRPLPTLNQLLDGMSRKKKHGEQFSDYLGKEQYWKNENQ